MFDGAISIHSLSSSHDTIVPCSQDNNVSSLHNDNVSPSHCDNLPNSQCSPLCSCDICPRLPVSCCCMGLRKLHLLGCVTRCIFVCQGPWGPALAGWLQGQSDRSVVCDGCNVKCELVSSLCSYLWSAVFTDFGSLKN